MINQGNNSWEQVITQAIGQRRDHAVAGLDTAATDGAGVGPVRSGIVGDATELIYQQFTVGSADPTCEPAVSITACAPAVYAPATVLSIPQPRRLLQQHRCYIRSADRPWPRGGTASRQDRSALPPQ